MKKKTKNNTKNNKIDLKKIKHKHPLLLRNICHHRNYHQWYLSST